MVLSWYGIGMVGMLLVWYWYSIGTVLVWHWYDSWIVPVLVWYWGVLVWYCYAAPNYQLNPKP